MAQRALSQGYKNAYHSPKKLFIISSMSRAAFICAFFLNILFLTAVFAEDSNSDEDAAEDIIADDDSITDEGIIATEDIITTFKENWTFSIFSNYNMGAFNQSDTSQYRTNKPWDLGLGIRYKKFSFSVSFSMPFTITGIDTNTDNDSSIDFDFEFATYFDKIYLEAYFKYYNNFYAFDTNESGGLDTLSTGIMATYVQNHKNHSLSSVIKLDKKQNISSGSLLYSLGAFFSSLDSTSETINNRDGRQNVIYFGPGIGYSYIWVFDNGLFLNASVIFLTNAGINLSTDKWLFIPYLEPTFVFGYHKTTWAFNIKVMYKTTVLLWDTAFFQTSTDSNYSLLTLFTIALTFTKRF
jgi:hypothetical protein